MIRIMEHAENDVQDVLHEVLERVSQEVRFGASFSSRLNSVTVAYRRNSYCKMFILQIGNSFDVRCPSVESEPLEDSRIKLIRMPDGIYVFDRDGILAIVDVS